ncbi:hypothetical protein DAKH74_018500 [Maudiozyma humilis]|uniref:C2 NT-type domain-containing protein n=1 Tax=Maudiozyma humilis TaxID=51915 RepID=A0AAV5RXG6_MAUHU|nr:hypothetical protein DAKH74_018500 [Kazachstania humilis]
MLSHSSKSRRPKFLFFLQINELVNIPQSSGFCFVRWSIRDGTGTKSSAVSTAASASTGSDGTQYRVTSQSKGTTPRVAVLHHRAQWNYKLERAVQVKLQVDRQRNLHKKDLILDIFFEFVDGAGAGAGATSPSSHRVTNKIQLGTVVVNLADYVREDEMPITNRFLLKHSKVNSIINVTVQMKLVRGTYNDFIAASHGSSGVLSGSSDTNTSSVPGSPRRGDTPASFPATAPGISAASAGPSLGMGISTSGNSGNGNNNSSAPPHSLQSGASSGTRGLSTISSSMNPLVDSLYARTFQLPWDARPGELSPRECIDDIVRGGDGWAKNENGINLIDLQALRLHEMEMEYYGAGGSGTGAVVAAASVSGTGAGAGAGTGAGQGDSRADSNSDDYWNSMDRREFMERRQEMTRDMNNRNSSSKRTSSNSPSPAGHRGSISAGPAVRDARSWSISHAV